MRNGAEPRHHQHRSSQPRVKRRVSHKKIEKHDDDSIFVKNAESLMKHIEGILRYSEDTVTQEYKEVNKLLGAYVKKNPAISTGLATLLGTAVGLILSKTYLSGSRDYSILEKINIKNWPASAHSLDFTKGLLDIVTHQVKNHTMELLDTIMQDYLKKYPLQTAGATVLLGASLALIMRRR